MSRQDIGTSDSAMRPHYDTDRFFQNTRCPYFPCHEGVDHSEFNCLFCYCPLYALGPHCGGAFAYTAQGIKDCSHCTRLHEGDRGVDIVRAAFSHLAELARQHEDEEMRS